MRQKKGGYIFREKYSEIILFLIFPLMYFSLWKEVGSFPFGDKKAVIVFCGFCVICMMDLIPIWGFLRYRNMIVIDETGIHHHYRRTTLSNPSTFWKHMHRLYPWNNFTEFNFEWQIGGSRNANVLRFLILTDIEGNEERIGIFSFRGRISKYIQAIEECSGGKCVLDRINYEKNRSNRFYLYLSVFWRFAFFLLPLIILMSLVL